MQWSVVRSWCAYDDATLAQGRLELCARDAARRVGVMLRECFERVASVARQPPDGGLLPLEWRPLGALVGLDGGDDVDIRT